MVGRICLKCVAQRYDLLVVALAKGIASVRQTGENVVAEVEPFGLEDGFDPGDPDAPRLLALVNDWLKLTTVLNELARSMGQHDFYPFVMSRAVLKKMYFIHKVVRSATAG